MRLGVDVGTTLTKVVLFGEDGEVVDKRAAATPLRRPAPGQYEIAIEQLVTETLGLVGQLTGPAVDLICLTGQGDGLWLLDARGCAARPALTWLDARGAAVCESWARNGVWERVFARTRNAPFPGAGGALLAALDETEPQALDAARTATHCQHVLFERLTGVRTATPACATLPVFDPSTAEYDHEALRLTGLTKRRDLLPPVSRTPVAMAPALAGGVMVATGPYDLPAAAFGVGLQTPGDGVLILGTTLACQVLVDRLEPAEAPVGLTLCTADGQGWLRAMPAMVGTACLDWVLRLVGAEHAQLGALLRDSPPGARGVAALPFLAPSGERAPFADSAARAELSGLSLETTPADVVRAVCEALGYAARHCFEAAGLTGNVVVCGGGSASRELVQLLADILERPLALAADDEPAARGAVLAATGQRADLAQTSVSPERKYDWAAGYAHYQERVMVAREHRWHASRIERRSA